MKKDRYHHFKLELSRLIRHEGFENLSKDAETIDRIFNLLTEEKYTEKIEGFLSSTEIIRFGGDMSKEMANKIYQKILKWWSLTKTKLFN